MKWLRWPMLVLTFSIDIRVRAETTGDCWGKKVPCAVQAETNKRSLIAKEMHASLGPGALLEQRDDKTIELVRGDFYVETSKPVVFQTPYAKVWCDDECKAIFTRQSESLNVKNLAGRLLVQRNGDTKVYVVPPGLQIFVGEVTSEGQSLMEFPQSLPWESTVKQWAALYPGTLEQLKPALVTFREVWKAAVESVSELHKSEASRTIASYSRSQAEERARQEAREREDQRLRELFREKNP